MVKEEPINDSADTNLNYENLSDESEPADINININYLDGTTKPKNEYAPESPEEESFVSCFFFSNAQAWH